MTVNIEERLQPCWALVPTNNRKAALVPMLDKIHEEVQELENAVDVLFNSPDEGTAYGKAREHLLEESVDVQTAVTTLQRIIATEDEIRLACAKVNIKCRLRGYHGEEPDKWE